MQDDRNTVYLLLYKLLYATMPLSLRPCSFSLFILSFQLQITSVNAEHRYTHHQGISNYNDLIKGNLHTCVSIGQHTLEKNRLKLIIVFTVNEQLFRIQARNLV